MDGPITATGAQQDCKLVGRIDRHLGSAGTVWRGVLIGALTTILLLARGGGAALREKSVVVELREGDEKQVTILLISTEEWDNALRKVGM
jgi:hypothetical protein